MFSTGPVIRRGKDKGTKGGATTRSSETGPGELTESTSGVVSEKDEMGVSVSSENIEVSEGSGSGRRLITDWATADCSGTTSVDGEMGPRISGRKPKQLGEKFLAFAIHAPRGFKQESGKVEGGTRVSDQVGGRERAGDSNVHTKPFAFTPQGNGHIPWSAARVLALTQDSLLLHDRAQVSLAGDLVNEIADSVVTDNEVPVRAAADRMISINV